jgi:N-carbamoyl-L-amino-acid hydrolase
VVTGALGLRWYDVVVTGQDAHAGPTPMHLRKDSMLAASRIVEEVNRIALAHQPAGRGTAGFMQVKPNSRNVVPGEVRLSVDLRHAYKAELDAMEAELRKACAQIENRGGVRIEIQCVTDHAPLAFDAGLVASVRNSTEQLGYRHMDIVSGAGHDACYVARVAPTAMIFVPCESGISHNEIENAEPEHLEAGANVLLSAVLDRAVRQK